MSSTITPRPLVMRPSELKSHDRGGGARTTPLVTLTLFVAVAVSVTALDSGAVVDFGGGGGTVASDAPVVAMAPAAGVYVDVRTLPKFFQCEELTSAVVGYA